MIKVLVIDDDPHLLRLVEANLKARGYATEAASSAEEGLALLRQADYSCVLLDLMLPGVSGQQFIREARLFSNVPIVVMSALGEEERKVEALDLGADDYLTKPFGVAELLARLRAAIRRYGGAANAKAAYAGFSFDPGGGFVRVNGAEIKLTPIEYALLLRLSQAAGNTVSHAELLDAVWGRGSGEDHYLHVYIGRLRRKMGENAAIESVPGTGYRLIV